MEWRRVIASNGEQLEEDPREISPDEVCLVLLGVLGREEVWMEETDDHIRLCYRDEERAFTVVVAGKSSDLAPFREFVIVFNAGAAMLNGEAWEAALPPRFHAAFEEHLRTLPKMDYKSNPAFAIHLALAQTLGVDLYNAYRRNGYRAALSDRSEFKRYMLIEFRRRQKQSTPPSFSTAL